MPFAPTRRELFLALLLSIGYFVPYHALNNFALSFGFPFLNQAVFGNESTTTMLLNQKETTSRNKIQLMKKTRVSKEEDDATLVALVAPQPTSRGLFHNSNEVVHVVHTRFMQHQHELRNLARARMDLFQTMTLPSMTRQSHKDFLWILWVEPHLEPEVRKEFLQLVTAPAVKESGLHILVIGSRAKMPNFRDNADFFDKLMESSIYHGTYDLLMDYKEAANTRPYLDTILDADDAVFTDFVASLQADATKTLSRSRLSHDYRLWCAPVSLYWGFYNPWVSPQQSIQSGFFVGQNHVKTTKECPTGGFTRGFAVNTTTAHFPQAPRHQVHLKAPPCDFSPHKCLQRMHAGAAEYPVVRARTPASVAVADSLPIKNSKSDNLKLWKNKQDDTWALLEQHFGIHKQKMTQMWQRLDSNMLAVILDGMVGICIEGHSCKRADKEALKTLKVRYKYPERFGLLPAKKEGGIEERRDRHSTAHEPPKKKDATKLKTAKTMTHHKHLDNKMKPKKAARPPKPSAKAGSALEEDDPFAAAAAKPAQAETPEQALLLRGNSGDLSVESF